MDFEKCRKNAKPINLKNALVQNYDFPSTIIWCIVKFADLKTSAKLSKSCKALKKLQKRNESTLRNFNACYRLNSPKSSLYSTDSEWILKMLSQKTVPIERIKILNSIKLFCVNRPFLTTALQHLDLSLAEDSIEIVTYDYLDYKTLCQIMQPKVKSFNFTFSTKDVNNPLLLAFKKLENASVI
uniref:F-box domain-containing protein n=1 Tax=Panagrolaimus sp. ES5 TaxID=591445 RepID=A0AC34GN33_9BILA